MSSDNTNTTDRSSPDYLAQLLKDKKQFQNLPAVFTHAERLLDREIYKVRCNLFHLQSNKEPMVLPDADGEIIQLTEKLFVPQREHPDFNFVGRILGPRGMTAKQLEQDTGCKIMVRGKGSMRDKQKEDMNRGKPNWEHLNEELHVLITVEDTENRAKVKLARAVDEVRKLLVPSPEGEDDLKKMQLMELAIINGTYGAQERQKAILQAAAAAAAQQPFLRPSLSFPHIRAAAAAQPQLLISPPRYPATTLSTGGLVSPNAPPPLMSPTDAAASALLYPGTYLNIDPAYAGTATPQSTALIDIAQLQVDGGNAIRNERRVTNARAHPYNKVTM